MIEYIRIQNSKKESLKLFLTNPETSNNISVRDIKNLGYKNSVNTTQIINLDGKIFNNQVMDQRNITMTLGFESSDNVEKTRQIVYNHFPSKEKIRFEIKTNRILYYIDGYIESCDPTIFDQQGDETIQISIICPNPYFNEYELFSEEMNGSIALFYFPFWNECEWGLCTTYFDIDKKQKTWGDMLQYTYQWLENNEI